MKPTDSKQNDLEYKSSMIDLWINQGYKVILQIDDQKEDLETRAEIKIPITNKGYDLSIEY
jgi:hypothetical protein